ncbi:transposase [candidate division KSB1 bacterium]|nr:transposase [candidate division KSB1 bacterium]
MPQSLVKIYVHLTFSTKKWQPFIDQKIEKELFPYMAKIFREKDSPSLAINGVEDHVHCLFLLSKKIPICDVVEEVKKCSSKWIKTKGVEYKNFYWQHGYGAFSVSQSGVEPVKKYIAKQKIHHHKKTFKKEFVELLKKYEVKYDERYVWD